MAEADAEERDLRLDRLLRHLDRIRAGGGIARAVREEDAVGVVRHRVLKRGLRGNDRHADAAVGEESEDIGLDAEVVGNDVVR